MTSIAQPRLNVENSTNKLNLIVAANFQRKYPVLSEKINSLIYSRNMGFPEEVHFPFGGYTKPMVEFDGSRKYNNLADVQEFTVKNREYDNGLKFEVKVLERAGAMSALHQMQLLNQPERQIDAMIRQGQNNFLRLVFLLIKTGSTTLLGTTFDGEPLFSATHSTVAGSAGTQSNIVTGTGTTVAQIDSDITDVITRFSTFVWEEDNQSPDESLSMLNEFENVDDVLEKILFVIPQEISGNFSRLSKSGLLNNSTGVNINLNYIIRPFSQNSGDPNDWHAFYIGDPDETKRPFYRQIEKPITPDFPTAQDESVRNEKVLNYGVSGREVNCPNLWWQAIQVTNA